MLEAIDLAAVLAQIVEPWSPRTVAVLNDHDLRVVRTQGAFTRHSHPETDEVFLVLSGSLKIRMDEDRKSTRLNSSHANISPLPLPAALPIGRHDACPSPPPGPPPAQRSPSGGPPARPPS